MEQQQKVAAQQKPDAWAYGPDRRQLCDLAYSFAQQVKDKFLWLSATVARCAVDGVPLLSGVADEWKRLDAFDDFCRSRVLSFHVED